VEVVVLGSLEIKGAAAFSSHRFLIQQAVPLGSKWMTTDFFLL
jgi:hypothetical protein